MEGNYQLCAFSSLDPIWCFSRVSGQVFYHIILPVNLSKFQVFQDCQSTLIVEEKISFDLTTQQNNNFSELLLQFQNSEFAENTQKKQKKDFKMLHQLLKIQQEQCL